MRDRDALSEREKELICFCYEGVLPILRQREKENGCGWVNHLDSNDCVRAE